MICLPLATNFSLTLLAALLSVSTQQSSIRVRAQGPPRVQGQFSMTPTIEVHTLVLYDVGDIVRNLTPRESLPDLTPEAEEAQRREQLQQTLERLDKAMRTYVEPAWRDESYTLSPAAGAVLAANATEAQHAWIRSFLANLRARPNRMLSSSVVYIEVPRGHLKELGVERTATLLSAPDGERKLIAKAQNIAGVEIPRGPSVVVFPIQEATVAVLNEVAYIKTYDLRFIEPEQVLIADPVVETVSEGYTLGMTCVPLPEGVYAAAVQFTRSAIQRPIPQHEIRLATDPPSSGKISTPVVTKVSLSSTIKLRSGESIAFGTPGNDEETDLLVIVSLRELSPVSPGSGKEEVR